MGRLALIALVAGGCGRVAFDPVASTTDDGGAIDGCESMLWTPAASLVTPNSTADDWGPFLSEDRQTLIFSSNRTGGPSYYDLYKATRVGTGVFDPPLSYYQSIWNDDDPWLDGQQLWFNDDRSGDMDIFVGTLGNLVNATVEPGISLPGIDDQCPELSSDKLTLYFESSRLGTPDLFRATRATTGSPWGTPEVVPLSTAGFDCCMSISDNGSVVYVSDNGNPADGRKVMMSMLVGTTFTTPYEFPGTVGNGDALDVYITRDGLTVISALDKGDARGTDLYVSDYGPQACP